MSPLITTLGSSSSLGYGRSFNSFIKKPTITSPTWQQSDRPIRITITSSSYQKSGPASNHAKSSWELSTDINFSNIVSSSYNDTSNLTSWTPSALLSGLTTYYVRVRYSDNTYNSNWSVSSFTTANALTPLVNGSTTVNTGGTFTVPSNCYVIRAQLNSISGSGSRVNVTFDVIPGEVFYVSNGGIFLNPSPYTQSNCFAQAGYNGTNGSNGPHGSGGSGGSAGVLSSGGTYAGGSGGSNGSGPCAGSGGGGGGETSGYAAFVGGPGTGGPEPYPGGVGGPGGKGWWGGRGGTGGGCQSPSSRGGGGGGGGGSSKINVPANRYASNIDSSTNSAPNNGAIIVY